jgi:hypothetical protein
MPLYRAYLELRMTAKTAKEVVEKWEEMVRSGNHYLAVDEWVENYNYDAGGTWQEVEVGE